MHESAHGLERTKRPAWQLLGQTDMPQLRKTSLNYIHENLCWDSDQISQLVRPLESPILTRYVILR